MQVTSICGASIIIWGHYGKTYSFVAGSKHMISANDSISISVKEHSKCTKTFGQLIYLTAPLQLSDAGAGVVFGRKLNRPWLSPSGTTVRHFTYSCRLLQWYRLEVSQFSNLCYPLSYFGTGKHSSKFSILSIEISVQLSNHSHWNSCLRWFIGVKNSQMFIQFKTSPGLEIITRWDPLPISMVLRSEGSLESEMLSLARTSKYVNSTSGVEFLV